MLVMFTFYHGIHHHFSPPFGEYVWMFFQPPFTSKSKFCLILSTMGFSTTRNLFGCVFVFLSLRIIGPSKLAILRTLSLRHTGSNPSIGGSWGSLGFLKSKTTPGQATLVFVLYTLIPGISVCLATRSVLQGAQEAGVGCS